MWSEGPIAVAWLEEGERGLHVTDRTVCLLEGALYDIPGVEPTVDPGGSQAARLTHVYERFGEDVLPRLRGEFWALLWSRQRMEGIVLTDQIGSSVPYWAAAVDGMIVASEVPELLDCLPRHPPPDELALAHWLMMTGPRAGTTLFAGVQRLRAGHLLRLSPGGGRSERYWAPIPHQPLGGSRDDQARRLLEALELAVQRRCPSEVPAGILLSGGLDSSTVAALAAREGAVRAYSAVFPDHPAMDESSLIERMAEHVGIHSTRLVVRQGSTLSGALDYLRAWKLPPTSPNLFFWAPLLERAAADGVRVMLDGEGGDELFAFSPYLVADRLLHGRLRSALALSRRWPGESTPPSRDLLRLRLHLAGARPLVPAVAHRLVRRARGVEHYAPSWLPDGLAGRWLETENSSFAWKEITGPRWWAYIVDLVTRGAGPSVVYEQARRRGRLAGVAARHPLVDADVIELVLRLDPELAFDSRFPRAMLREAIVGLVPDEVRLRRGKSNFDALFHQLLAGPELPAVQALLDPRRSQLGHYIDMAAIDADLLRERPLGGRALGRWAAQVWRLVTAECWLRSQADADGLERLRGELALPGAEPVFEVSPSG